MKLVVIFLCVSAPGVALVCTNTCSYANDGECDDGSPGSLYSICTCGTDCADCGVQTCGASDDDDLCGEGYRTCEKNGNYWCCDRDSSHSACSSTTYYCEQKASKKAKKTAVGVIIAIAIIIPLAIIGGIVACCFCCTGCPGYQATHRQAPPPQQPVVTTVQYAQAPKHVELQAVQA